MKVRTDRRGEFKVIYFELPTYGVDPRAIVKKIEAMAEAWNGPETVLFRGQGPVWLYGMLVHAAHATPNVATFEPRKNGYVVVHQHGGRWQAGEVILSETVGMTVEGGEIIGGEDVASKPRLVIAVGGPPHSGKSVFLAELYRQLLDRMPGEVFLQRGCPDGEGMWSAESDPSMVKTIRQKGKFGEEFTSWATDAIRGLQKGFAITLLDLGGKRLPPNDEMLRASTHGVILSSKEDETSAWVEYAQSFGCEVLAVLDSRLVRDEARELDSSARSAVDLTTAPAKGILVNLDREGSKDPYQDAVSLLADWLMAKVYSAKEPEKGGKS